MPGNYKTDFKRYKRKLRWKGNKYPAFQKMGAHLCPSCGVPLQYIGHHGYEDLFLCPDCGATWDRDTLDTPWHDDIYAPADAHDFPDDDA